MSTTLALPNQVRRLEEQAMTSLRRAKRTSAQSEKFKRAAVWVLGLPLLPDLVGLQRHLNIGIALLNSPVSDGLSSQDLSALARNLNRVLGQLRSIVRACGTNTSKFRKRALRCCTPNTTRMRQA